MLQLTEHSVTASLRGIKDRSENLTEGIPESTSKIPSEQ